MYEKGIAIRLEYQRGTEYRWEEKLKYAWLRGHISHAEYDKRISLDIPKEG